MSGASSARTLLRVLRSEGPRAVLARALDRLADFDRNERLMEIAPSAWPRLQARQGLLNVLPTAPSVSLGGVQIQAVRRLALEAARRPLSVLYPRAGAWRLEVRMTGLRLALPVAAAPLALVLREAARSAGASVVHVENAAGLPLGALAEVAEEQPLILSLHDFAPFCPRPMLIERPAGRFCGGSRDALRCATCLAADGSGGRGTIETLRADGARLLRAARALVFPSEFLRARFGEWVGGLDAVPQAVIAPSSGARVQPSRAPAGAPHAAFVGAARADKGADVFAALAQRLRGTAWRFSAYGGGDPEVLARLRAAGVRVHGYYRAGSLPTRLLADGVSVALLVSIGPESYGLTLDECVAAGVPSIVFDVGAPAERVRAWNAGAVVPLAEGVEGVARVLREADAWPRVVPPPDLPTPHSAAQAHAALYRRLGLEVAP